MKKLIAYTLMVCFIWLSSQHWVDEDYAIYFEGRKAYIWKLLPEFDGTMYMGEASEQEALEYIKHWYYMHSA